MDLKLNYSESLSSLSSQRRIMTLSRSLRIRLEPSISLYESVLDGPFKAFSRGRNAQAKRDLVTVECIRKDLMMEARQLKRESGPFKRVSLEYRIEYRI